MTRKDQGDRERLVYDEQGVFHLLMQDHRTVEELLEMAISADEDELHGLVQRLKLEIMLHANVEDRVVYSAIEQQSGMAGAISHARDQHAEIESILFDLDGLKPGRAMQSRLEDLREALTSHFQEEEDDVLPRAAALIDQTTSRDLASQFESERLSERDILLETEPGFEELDESQFTLAEDIEAEHRE
jgi:iron-sulfur cluster repair protein YtfE (RIC family)